MPAKSVFTVIGGDKRLYFLAQELLKTWLGLRFDPGSSSAPKVARYHEYDEER